MRHRFELFGIICSFALTASGADAPVPVNLASSKELPEGPGLAAALVADAKLGARPEVIFADDFEAGKLGERWDESGNRDGQVLSLTDPGTAQLGRRCLRVEAHLGGDTGGRVEAKRGGGGVGSQRRARRFIRSHVMVPFWLRR